VEQTPKDHAERKGYRKSPGRQYGYEYDPLYGRTKQPGGGQGEVPTRSGLNASHRSEALIQRPDPRRTRQLLRQNILASKSRPVDESLEQDDYYEEAEEAPAETFSYNQRQLSRSGQVAQSRAALTRNLGLTEEEDDEYDYDALEDEYDVDPVDYSGRHLTSRLGQDLDRSRLPARASRNVRPPDDDDGYDDYEDAAYVGEEEEEAPGKGKKKKKGVTRRNLLLGLGVVAVGGAGVVGYELGPKLPQALGSVGTNIEKQLQDEFNKGLAQGAEAARKELISGLENLEGVSLNAAVEAARLTRVAYDVFVSPVVKLYSQIAGNVLTAMLSAFKTGRNWLARINQDNATLAAIQTVLESWVNQVQNLPKQLDTITQADLDGAQAYLRSLQTMIKNEQAKLNSPQGTPTTPALPQKPTSQTTPKQ
jgi:hypothetical protein